MHKTPTFAGFGRIHGRQRYPQFFREADSWTQTCNLSLLVEGIGHRTKS